MTFLCPFRGVEQRLSCFLHQNLPRGLLGTFAYDPHSGLAGVLVEMHLVEVLQE